MHWFYCLLCGWLLLSTVSGSFITLRSTAHNRHAVKILDATYSRTNPPAANACVYDNANLLLGLNPGFEDNTLPLLGNSRFGNKYWTCTSADNTITPWGYNTTFVYHETRAISTWSRNAQVKCSIIVDLPNVDTAQGSIFTIAAMVKLMGVVETNSITVWAEGTMMTASGMVPYYPSSGGVSLPITSPFFRVQTTFKTFTTTAKISLQMYGGVTSVVYDDISVTPSNAACLQIADPTPPINPFAPTTPPPTTPTPTTPVPTTPPPTDPPSAQPTQPITTTAPPSTTTTPTTGTTTTQPTNGPAQPTNGPTQPTNGGGGGDGGMTPTPSMPTPPPPPPASSSTGIGIDQQQQILTPQPTWMAQNQVAFIVIVVCIVIAVVLGVIIYVYHRVKKNDIRQLLHMKAQKMMNGENAA